MQLSLLNGWVDGRVAQPADGQRVLAYSWIENPEESLPMFKDLHIEYAGITVSGPSVRLYEKQFVDEGLHRRIAFWQPIDPLPDVS